MGDGHRTVGDARALWTQPPSAHSYLSSSLLCTPSSTDAIPIEHESLVAIEWESEAVDASPHSLQFSRSGGRVKPCPLPPFPEFLLAWPFALGVWND